MSCATRPIRRCGIGPRFALARVLVGESENPVVDGLIRRKARSLGCRPSHLRRVLQGRPVSAKAAGRILEAAGVA